ncbi:MULTISPECIES: DUF2997 domain-containing protein [Planktothrix]|jgi:hypothetical protein|uniref:DUF2997 domain-containing protein n=1 Tax=Planktothrix rubescens CCAP 1459/22 TaxID=329571 RepID=A0A6J7ZEG2_PLARU|nr:MULTISPECIES: DUF2997 domain-containing protein [Planktothrix]CAD5984612.1 hypothetical protein NO108_04967 [Planktothrix rubescens]BBD57195.1 hypothetical protein NIES204_45310 [Planktothrix agardhii NIES-204]CAC5339710.1 conserved hypothetical protein [Planktothrix rubescens NIVA-CYA 18]CAD5984966.1 hypothetical protein NO365_04446 [Planktothrix agardhii]CAD5985518.1 hypothetical protein PCC7821_04969 [Planktothrix rubescens NIVA-CYA 18]
MQYYKVEFTINPDGTITEKVLNGSGSSCTELTKDLELGEVKSQQLLPEYQEQNLINQEQEDNLWQGF